MNTTILTQKYMILKLNPCLTFVEHLEFKKKIFNTFFTNSVSCRKQVASSANKLIFTSSLFILIPFICENFN